MCDPTYPVFRSASILKVQPGLDAAHAVLVGQKLHDADADFARTMVGKIGSLAGVKDASPSQEKLELRVRISPAITIDFRPIEFLWCGEAMQFRACMTTSIGKRKAKIWTRYNFKGVQTHKETVAEFFRWVEKNNVSVHDECVGFYKTQIADAKVRADLTRTYMITIKLVSVANSTIRTELEREFTSQYEDEPEGSRKAYEILHNELLDDCGLALPALGGNNTRLVGFRYPRRGQVLDSDKAPLPKVPAPPIADDSFEALCIVQHDNNNLNITGIAHEPVPPDDFRKSAPHVVSGEISFELGNAF